MQSPELNAWAQYRENRKKLGKLLWLTSASNLLVECFQLASVLVISSPDTVVHQLALRLVTSVRHQASRTKYFVKTHRLISPISWCDHTIRGFVVLYQYWATSTCLTSNSHYLHSYKRSWSGKCKYRSLDQITKAVIFPVKTVSANSTHWIILQEAGVTHLLYSLEGLPSQHR